MVQYPVKDFRTVEVALSYAEGPSNGEPVLLIHGTASRWQPFLPIMPGLSEYFHVFAIDLRGHGRSDHTPGEYRLDDYTNDMHTFIAKNVGKPAVIYGHSLGALVAINLAARYPKSVRKLVLGDPPLFYHNTSIQDIFWQKAFQDLLDFKLAHPDPGEMNAWLAQNMPKMSAERREERVRSLETLDPDVVRAVITDALMEGISLPILASKIDCPVLLLQGDPKLGSALREEDVTFAMTYFHNIHLLKMETVGHGIIPAVLLPKLVEFIGINENRPHKKRISPQKTRNTRTGGSDMAQKKVTAGRDQLGDFAPKFAELNDDVLFGEVWSREEQLSARDRSMITVTALMASGILDQSLRAHLEKAKENGITKDEMVEVITHVAFYAGWPKAWAAFRLAKEIFSA